VTTWNRNVSVGVGNTCPWSSFTTFVILNENTGGGAVVVVVGLGAGAVVVVVGLGAGLGVVVGGDVRGVGAWQVAETFPVSL
jgi:hypothetical protein